MARYMATGTGTVLGKRVEVSAMRADGTQFPVELAITPISGDGPPLFTAYLRDISERKRAEEALAQEHRQLRQVIDTVPVAMAMFDTEMRYLAYSLKWLVDNDLAGQTLIGRSHYEVVPGLPERLRETHRRALAGETLAQSEDPILNDRGEMHYWRWALTPWYSPSGEVGGVILASDLVDDLVRGREAALDASRLKGEFLATMSHEIRTPMTGILGMNELLMGTALTAEQQDYAGVVRDSSEALLTLLNDILDFSKIEAGKMLLDCEDFAPRLLAERAGNLLVAKAREKRIRLLTDVAPQVPARLHGDSGRLRQVLLNLLGNAVKFTETGEVSLCMTVEAETSAQVTLRFVVKDTGIGLSERARGGLFQPFMQADGSTTRKYGGTGLGLAISKQLVELMGGTIGVDSVEGQGSTFWFIVPFERVDARDEPPAPPSLGRPLPVQQTGDQGRETSVLPPPSCSSDRIILVAEDNPVNQKLALLQLRKLGYQAEAVANGREAVGAVARRRHALVLMDCQMPELDGFAATSEIRQLERRGGARLPIVAMTANAMAGDQEACLTAGMDDYLPKPVTTERLRTVLERWLPVAEAASERSHPCEQPLSFLEQSHNRCDPVGGLGQLEVV